jgi:hypothetical protein
MVRTTYTWTYSSSSDSTVNDRCLLVSTLVSPHPQRPWPTGRLVPAPAQAGGATMPAQLPLVLWLVAVAAVSTVGPRVSSGSVAPQHLPHERRRASAIPVSNATAGSLRSSSRLSKRGCPAAPTTAVLPHVRADTCAGAADGDFCRYACKEGFEASVRFKAGTSLGLLTRVAAGIRRVRVDVALGWVVSGD